MIPLFTKIQDALAPNRRRLRLYNMEYCFYCDRVRREAKRLNVPLTIVDVLSDHQGRARLQEGTGRARVPVLGIIEEDGAETFLPESEEIILYLRQLPEAGTLPSAD